MLIALACFGIAATPLARPSDVQFVGFSRNEAVAAFAVTFVHRDDTQGVHDTFELVHVIDSKTRVLLGSFRNGTIRAQGRPGGEQELLARNPSFAAAESRAEWLKLRTQGKFRFERPNKDHEDVRILLDGDVRARAEKQKTGLIVLRGENGAPLGFEAQARLFDGQMFSLGRFRREGLADVPQTAKLHTFVSKSGLYLAVLAEFTGGQDDTHFLPAVIELPGVPLSSATLGTIGFADHTLVQAEEIYSRLHPEMRGVYRRVIGRF